VRSGLLCGLHVHTGEVTANFESDVARPRAGYYAVIAGCRDLSLDRLTAVCDALYNFNKPKIVIQQGRTVSKEFSVPEGAIYEEERPLVSGFCLTIDMMAQYYIFLLFPL